MEQFCVEASNNTGYVLAYADGLYTVTDFAGGVVCEFMQEQPVVDAVQVVRCGECRYYAIFDSRCVLGHGLNEPDETDFCSYGEHRTPPAE